MVDSAADMLAEYLLGLKTSKFYFPLCMYWSQRYWGSTTMYLALFSQDVSQYRKNNPELWHKLCPKDQYKVYSVNVDYSKLKKEGQDFLSEMPHYKAA
jgi:NADH dehydrogenase (ubiquinone) 1 alpha subcomplex subunit 4